MSATSAQEPMKAKLVRLADANVTAKSYRERMVANSCWFAGTALLTGAGCVGSYHFLDQPAIAVSIMLPTLICAGLMLRFCAYVYEWDDTLSEAYAELEILRAESEAEDFSQWVETFLPGVDAI